MQSPSTFCQAKVVMQGGLLPCGSDFSEAL